MYELLRLMIANACKNGQTGSALWLVDDALQSERITREDYELLMRQLNAPDAEAVEADLRNALAEMRRQRDEGIDKRRALRTQLSVAEGALEAAKGVTDALGADLAGSAEDGDRLRARNTELSTACATLEGEVARYRDQWRDHVQHINTQNDLIASLKRDLAEVKNSPASDELLVERNQLREHVDRLQNRLTLADETSASRLREINGVVTSLQNRDAYVKTLEGLIRSAVTNGVTPAWFEGVQDI